MKISKSIKIILLFLVMFCFIPLSVFSKEKEEAKKNPIKGIIYNPQTNAIDTNAEINAYNYLNGKTYENGDVEVKKEVTKINDNGLYNVEFLVRGKEEVVTEIKDTYIVFVLDRSYTMKDNNRWIDAKKSVIDISKELSKIEGINMALVGFSGGKASDQTPYDDTVILRENFSSIPFTDNEIGNYDTNNQKGGGTNIYAGLLKANELLSNKIGKKYIILLSDGVPTFYYDENGYTLGPGNSDTKEKIIQVPECKDNTIALSQNLKNNGIEIYTIGYQLDKLTHTFTNNNIVYNEKNLAIETLIGIASSYNHYYQSDSNSLNTLISILKKIQVEMTTFKAGYNPIIIDNIGVHFKLDDSNNYGGLKTLVTNSNFEITDDWKSLGSFNINIDKTLQNGWYQTNNNFTLTYEKNTGEIKTIECTDNPEVYWEQEKYQYKINYYFNDILDESFTKYETSYLNTIIYAQDNYLLKDLESKNNIDKTTYFLDTNNHNNTSNIKISSDVKQNVLNIYYVDTNFTKESIDKYTNIDVINNSNISIPYIVEYNLEIKNARSKDEIVITIVDTLPSEIDEDNSNLNGGIYDKKNKTITWYFKENVGSNQSIYNINKKIVYSVTYINFDEISNNLLENKVVGKTKINTKETKSVSDKEAIELKIKGNVTVIYVDENNFKISDDSYLSGLVGENYITSFKNILGYTLIEEKYPKNDKGKFKEEDIIVKYIYKKNDGEIVHNVVKEGIEKISNINGNINYKIKVEASIKDYIGDIKLKIIDKLHYKIDINKSIIDNRCKYDNDLEITCEIDYLNDAQEIYNINEIFYFELSFININSKIITNNVISKIILENINDEKKAQANTSIPNGTVIINYITKDNKKLFDTITINDFIGNYYETIKKEFDEYHFIEVIGDDNGKIKEEVTYVTYIYDLVPLPPHTSAENNYSIKKEITLLIIFSLGIMISISSKKFLKL